MKEKFTAALKNGLIGGVLSGIISAVLNYSVLPFPRDIMDNVIGHGIGGFFCGFISAVIGILMYVRHRQQNSSTALKGGIDYELIQ